MRIRTLALTLTLTLNSACWQQAEKDASHKQINPRPTPCPVFGKGEDGLHWRCPK